MSDYEQAVFISYAWGGEREEIVNQIDQELQKRGVKIIRDKRDLGYKGSISEFMERIGRGNCVIVVISDKYLRSPNCMFELVEIAEGKQFHDRIFPIVLADANIYDPIKRIEYVRHWEVKRAELAEAMKTLDPANL
jgi:internalin A